MTPEEHKIVAAIRNAYEQTILNMAHQDADKAAVIEDLAQQLKAAQARIKELEPKPEPKLEVVP